MRLCLALEALKLSHDLTGLLKRMLEVLFAFCEEQVAGDVRQEFHYKGVIDKVE